MALLESTSEQGALVEPHLGSLSLNHVQLVPQSAGQLADDVVEDLLERFPGTAFRLHANVRVLKAHRFADLSGFMRHLDWFQEAARVHKRLGARAYSAHAGARADASLEDVFDAAKRAADLFDSPVAVEGHYPTLDGKDRWLLSSWNEYERLLASDLPMAIDLSHLNIVAKHSKCNGGGLVGDLLASPMCLEVHLSDNDGSGDQHQTLTDKPWWFELLPRINPSAVVFTEGNHLKRLEMTLS